MPDNPDLQPPRGLSAREIAQRNRDSSGKPLSNVMKTAATACELAQARDRRRAG